MESKFRLNSQKLFLTYAQCPLEPTEALEQLKICLSTVTIQEYVIAQEEHKDGHKHLHCFLDLSKKINIKSPTKLDLVLDGVTYHGKYEGVRTEEAVLKYVTKEGNFISSKPLEELLHRHECRVGKKKIIGKEIINLASTSHLAKHVQEVRPELVMDYDRLRRSFISFKRDLEPPLKCKDVRGIWIKGPPGIGKTHQV